MSIKSQGGVFGRNPTFNDVTVDGDLSIAGTLSVGGETITGLSYQGGWNADTNTPDIAASSPVTGQFWIVSVDGSTDVGGIANWTSGDWALYDGSNWQRVEGGNTDLTTGVSGQLSVANGGTGAADASTARTNLGLAIGVDVEGVDATILRSADIGSTVQGYDADTAKYDDTTANFTGTLQNGGSNVVVDSDIGSTVQAYDANILTSSDIGSTVQAYDADTAKLDVAQTFTGVQEFDGITTFNNYLNLENANVRINMLESDTTDLNTQIKSNAGVFDIRTVADNLASGTTRLSINHTSGDVTVSTGNLVIGTSGKGIDFSATSGTGTSELLDDYEEGTWTPSIGGSSVAGTYETSTAEGYYTKVGRLVTVNFKLVLDSTITAGGSGALIVSGLPYSCANTYTQTGTVLMERVNYSATATHVVSTFRTDSSSQLILTEVNANLNDSSVNISDVAATDLIACTVTYHTS